MPETSYVIGIDAGATKTVALLADAAGKLASRAKGSGANLVLHGELEVEKVLRSVVSGLGAPDESTGFPVDSLCIGIAGADRPGEGELVASIIERIGISRKVHVINDAHAALVAGAPTGVGIVVVAGTGSIAFGIDPHGNRARSGGWGYLLGDEGSAFWLGHAALRLGIRSIDGRGPATTLFEQICDRLEISSTQALVEWFYHQDNARIQVAELAPLVQIAADQGDDPAIELLDQAAHHLVQAAGSVQRQLDFAEDHPIVLAGGAFKACPSLEGRIGAALPCQQQCPQVLKGEPADGAVSIALERLFETRPPAA